MIKSGTTPIIKSKTSVRKPISKSDGTGLKIIPLGGLHEIGKNTCVFEYDDEIILLDAGLAFPTDGMHGVNIVLPDVTYLRENRHKIKGMIVTHGHEDHIGGIPFHLKQFDVPVIYGPRLAMALLQGKLEEAGVSDRTELRTVRPREIVRIGKSFLVEYIRNTHSIADSFTVAINTPVGVVIHTGDFKVDHTPVDGEFFDFQRLAEYGEKGVHCLLSDSTNAESPGFTPSESSVYPNLERIFAQAPGRILVTTFASSVHRLNIILSIAQKQGRAVAVVGRSMLNVIAHARNLGYIKCRDDLFIPLNSLRDTPDDKVLILTTGSQGEPLSALTRIAHGAHRQISIKRGDTVVFSANPIPGNTIAVVNTIDKLMMLGANVIYGRDKGIHVSGHGCQEDQKLMLALTRPKFFVPVHGEHRMLVKHSQTAQSMGIPAENMIIIDNGDVVELTPNSIAVIDKVKAGIEPVDSSRTGVVKDDVMRERRQLAEDGVITVAVAIDLNGQLIAKPKIHFRGVVTSVDHEVLNKSMTQAIENTLKDYWSELARSFEGQKEIDWVGVETQVERAIERSLKRELQPNNPLVVLLMNTPEGNIILSDENTPEEESATSTTAPQATGRRRTRTAARVAS
ncbi:ribonuclease J [Limnoraphis robusta]|jgi:ribonuclease J|uniref:Ribonuclease J n=1 Tax=Limnoraphis robusta CCNP1315 TaxID=3110306 RepID=A0ABU5TWK3_9CYAN|nr:ribonuclease J [Limnoraphis robusta]MEA5497720.1 ribonuclease J [Limnoraphis robusta BA-68 BA1]MEA5519302.1 ribonuclease J [Limnoraphis robusta CCNP1315]MEA5549044.1 ribonuclease J [Limnoraphis robusta CCNP1324]